MQEQQMYNDSLESQMLLQSHFDEERRKIADANRLMQKSMLDKQVEEVKTLQVHRMTQSVSNPILNVSLPPIYFPGSNEGSPQCVRKDKRHLQTFVKEALRRGGTLNKGIIRHFDLNSKQLYNEIKHRYGNHSTEFNIITGGF